MAFLKNINTRVRAAGLFDVSHMGQLRLHGFDAAAALERLVPVDVIDLPLNRQRYGLFQAQGGILDDLMITRCDGHYCWWSMPAARIADTAHLRAHCRCTLS